MASSVIRNQSATAALLEGGEITGDTMPRAEYKYFSGKDFNTTTAEAVAGVASGEFAGSEVLKNVLPRLDTKALRDDFFAKQSSEMLQALYKVDSGVTLNRAMSFMWEKYNLDTDRRDESYEPREAYSDTIRADVPTTPKQFALLIDAWQQDDAGRTQSIEAKDAKPMLNSVVREIKGIAGKNIDIKAAEYSAGFEGSEAFWAVRKDGIRDTLTGDLLLPTDQKGTLFYSNAGTDSNRVLSLLREAGALFAGRRFKEMEDAGVFSGNSSSADLEKNKQVYREVVSCMIGAELTKLVISDPSTAMYYANELRTRAKNAIWELSTESINNTWMMPHVGSEFVETMQRVVNHTKNSPLTYLGKSRQMAGEEPNLESIGLNRVDLSKTSYYPGLRVADVWRAPKTMEPVKLLEKSKFEGLDVKLDDESESTVDIIDIRKVLRVDERVREIYATAVAAAESESKPKTIMDSALSEAIVERMAVEAKLKETSDKLKEAEALVAGKQKLVKFTREALIDKRDVEAKLGIATGQVEELGEELAGSKTQLDKLTRQRQRLVEVAQKAQAEKRDVTNILKKTTIDKEDAEARFDIVVEQLEEDLDASEANGKVLKTLNDNLKGRHYKAGLYVNDLKKKHINLTSKYNNKLCEADELKDEIGEAKGDLVQLANKYNNKLGEVDSLNSENGRLVTKHDKAAILVGNIKKERNELADKLKNAEDNSASTQKERNQLANELKSVIQENGELTGELLRGQEASELRIEAEAEKIRTEEAEALAEKALSLVEGTFDESIELDEQPTEEQLKEAAEQEQRRKETLAKKEKKQAAILISDVEEFYSDTLRFEQINNSNDEASRKKEVVIVADTLTKIPEIRNKSTDIIKEILLAKKGHLNKLGLESAKGASEDDDKAEKLEIYNALREGVSLLMEPCAESRTKTKAGEAQKTVNRDHRVSKTGEVVTYAGKEAQETLEFLDIRKDIVGAFVEDMVNNRAKYMEVILNAEKPTKDACFEVFIDGNKDTLYAQVEKRIGDSLKRLKGCDVPQEAQVFVGKEAKEPPAMGDQR